MEGADCMASLKQACPGELPSLLKYITPEAVAGFDNVKYNGCCNETFASSGMSILESNQTAPTKPAVNDMVTDGANFQSKMFSKDEQTSDNSESSSQPHHSRSISISMPSSPSVLHSGASKRVMFDNVIFIDGKSNFASNVDTINIQPQKQMFHSQPLYMGDLKNKIYLDGKINGGKEQRNSKQGILRDKRFDSFKTWSGKLERQLSNLRGRPQEPVPDSGSSQNTDIETLPVDRYFDALEGPELDNLKASEVSVLPDDKQWPFLLRFPISSFGICLGVSSQAILWKTLATAPSTGFLHVHPFVNLVLWCVSLALVAIVSSIYLFKIILYFEAVKREYYHPIRVNFFFAPWIACLFLALGVPPSLDANLHASLWYVLMSPILCLELKIYGQWMSGGQRRLSKVANPSNHLSIVGNFVGALLGASMGLKEGPIFFFAIGLAHYIVLFVTLYQRLPTNETLPKELHPVFFLFVAAPSVACMAWARIQGDFDYGSRIAYFIALFLYVSLVVRINFFRGFRFSLAWWAYTFPMTGASIATIRYSTEVKNPLTQSLSVLLSAVSTLTVTALLVSTMLHAFILRDLFPNDISIAVSKRKPKSSKRRIHLRSASSDAKDARDSVSLNTLRPQLSV